MQAAQYFISHHAERRMAHSRKLYCTGAQLVFLGMRDLLRGRERELR